MALHEQWCCIVRLYKTRNVLDNVNFMNFEFPTAVKILAPCRHVDEFQRIEEVYCVHLFFYPKRTGYFLETTYHITCCFTQEEHNMRKVSNLTKVTLFLFHSLHFFPFVITGCSTTASFNKLRDEEKCLDRITVSSMHTQDRHFGKFVATSSIRVCWRVDASLWLMELN